MLPPAHAFVPASARPRDRARVCADRSVSNATAGNRTSRRASASISPCARLLMSSEVQAKWMNSAARVTSATLRESFLQPILDRLDVVIGRALDRLDPLGIGDAEVALDFREKRAGRRGKRRHLGDARLVGKRFEPRELDAHALTHESEFAKMVRPAPHTLAR